MLKVLYKFTITWQSYVEYTKFSSIHLEKHEFIKKFKDGASVMMPKIEKAKQIREAQNIAS